MFSRPPDGPPLRERRSKHQEGTGAFVVIALGADGLIQLFAPTWVAGMMRETGFAMDMPSGRQSIAPKKRRGSIRFPPVAAVREVAAGRL